MGKISNAERYKKLGMPYTTATTKLRKMILYDLLKRHNENICYRCGGEIDNIDLLSIEHKKSWVKNGNDLFWDLNNIVFSHVRCNKVQGGFLSNGNDIEHIEARNNENEWCCGCKQLLPLSNFYKKKWHDNRQRSVESYCKSCQSIRAKKKNSLGQRAEAEKIVQKK